MSEWSATDPVELEPVEAMSVVTYGPVVTWLEIVALALLVAVGPALVALAWKAAF